MFDFSRYPHLSALLTSNPERAHALLVPIELALASKSDIRIAQAMRWATALGLCVEDILSQIPEIPPTLLLPRDLDLLTLVPWHIGNVELSVAAGLKYKECGYTDETLVAVSSRYADLPKTWAWVLAHDGGPNLDRKPVDCLAECTDGLYGGMDKVGIAIWHIHGPRKHVMDLPASVDTNAHNDCAFVSPFGDKPNLSVRRFRGTSSSHGTVVFRLK